ncbi:MAG: hypothetical protein QM529_05500, partial [Hydrotalea sp.]|nr:hypothetical protein [Hydrotalea sp.]
VGFSLSDVSWAQKISASNGPQSSGVKVAGGASYIAKSGATLSDFGRSTALTGNCAVISANTLFADSQGVSAGVLGSGSVSTNKCNLAGNPDVNAVAGFTDLQIATAINNGKVSLLDWDASHPVAYSVWSEVLGNFATIVGVNSLAGQGVNFESGSKVAMLTSVWDSLNNKQQANLSGVVSNKTWVVAAAADKSICESKLGYTYDNGTCKDSSAAGSGGSAKDDAGFVLAPQVALEYDNGMLHADINVKYIHELFNVRYFGSEGSVSGQKESGAITYTSIAGPLALFVGAGLGVNF